MPARPPASKRAKNAVDDLRGVTRLVIDATRGMTDLVEAMHHTIGGGPSILRRPLDGPTRLVTRPVYGSIRGVTRLVGVGLDVALARLAPLLREGAPGAEREAVLAAVNGVLGDYLAESGNPLAIEMRLRSRGRPLELENEALRLTLPRASGKLLVLVHGSCMNDLRWTRLGHDHGAALARDLGFTPVYLHYTAACTYRRTGAPSLRCSAHLTTAHCSSAVMARLPIVRNRRTRTPPRSATAPTFTTQRESTSCSCEAAGRVASLASAPPGWPVRAARVAWQGRARPSRRWGGGHCPSGRARHGSADADESAARPRRDRPAGPYSAQDRLLARRHAMADPIRPVHPQTLIFEKGYDPQRSEGAAVPPVFRTSTFVFPSAAAGKRAFEIAYGLREPDAGESPALIYTRVNNPNAEILEDRVTVWDRAEAAALFSSGMGAISTTCLTFLRPGDTVLFSDPVYGGSEFFLRKILPEYGIRTVPFPVAATEEELARRAAAEPHLRLVFLESPANPTMQLCDVPAARMVAERSGRPGRPVLVLVDNTFLGPIFSQPLALGAHLVLYSATKFFGGHSDLVAGLAMGSRELLAQVRGMRTILGSTSDADTAWLISRSLGTLQLRMEQQQRNARVLIDRLRADPRVARVLYPGLAEMGAAQVERWRRQCSGSGSVVTFEVRGGEAEAFRVLDGLRRVRLAVSLGGIETLIEHPWSMTHADMTPEQKRRAGITEAMVRLSVGLEHPEDMAADLAQALALA